GCSPNSVAVGGAMTCVSTFLNDVDNQGDTLHVTGFNDVVHAAAPTGDVDSGNILSRTGLFFSAGVMCVGHVSGGGSATPWIGATSCDVPTGGTITTASFSHYTVQAADFGLPGNILPDTAHWTWTDLCNGIGSPLGTGTQDPGQASQGCNGVTPNDTPAGSSVTVTQGANANIAITPPPANQPVGTNHLLTITAPSPHA